jgi:RHS repeat-associated protein
LAAITYKKNGTVLGNLTYEHDPAGRVTSVGGSYARTGLPGALATTSYNDGNRQTAFGLQTLTYDLNGNLTSDGSNTYTWNARNELTSISGPGLSASFQYDSVGRRTSKTINGVTTGFLYNGDNIAQEQSGGSATANILGGGLDEFFGRSEASGTTSPLVDSLGSPIAVADSSGAVQTEYSYEPFGGTSTTGTASTNPSQYTGRENDGTGLYYYRARYYSPGLQRFISEDPIGLLGGGNIYAYASNNPISFSDPFGLISGGGPLSFLVGFIGSGPRVGLGGPPPSLRDMLGWAGITLNDCAYKAGVYTGIAVQIAVAVAEPFLAPEIEAEVAAAGSEAEAAAGGAAGGAAEAGGAEGAAAADAEAAADTGGAGQANHYSGADKPWTAGAEPGSKYTQVDKNGDALQTAIYDKNGDVVGHVDYKNHGPGAASGHGHEFPTPGDPSSGHGRGKPHIPHDKLPPGWGDLPPGVKPRTPIGH